MSYEEYAKKLGKPTEYFEQLYNKIYSDLKKVYPNLPDNKLQARAKYVLYSKVKQQLRSPAVAYEGVVIGYSGVRDLTAGARASAISLYQQNPVQAIQAGVVDSNGTPIDNREFLPNGRKNPWFGKPITPTYVRDIYVIGHLYEKEEPYSMLYVQQISNDQAKVNQQIPLGQYVVFRANSRGKVQNLETLRASRVTTFEPLPKSVDVISLLRGAPEEFIVPALSELEAWHNEHANQFNRFAIVEGDVVIARTEPTAAGNQLIVIEDESIAGLDNEGVTVWVPPHCKVDYGPGSHVIVTGRTTAGAGWNPETRQTDENITRMMINAFGVFPEFTVPVGVVESLDYEISL